MENQRKLLFLLKKKLWAMEANMDFKIYLKSNA
jgi:hypothetical protein